MEAQITTLDTTESELKVQATVSYEETYSVSDIESKIEYLTSELQRFTDLKNRWLEGQAQG